MNYVFFECAFAPYKYPEELITTRGDMLELRQSMRDRVAPERRLSWAAYKAINHKLCERADLFNPFYLVRRYMAYGRQFRRVAFNNT